MSAPQHPHSYCTSDITVDVDGGGALVGQVGHVDTVEDAPKRLQVVGDVFPLVGGDVAECG
jgi:hypothetical protein